MVENDRQKLKDAICELVNIAEDADITREVFEMLDNAGADAIDCLDKLSGYEAIGTVEDFKALKEKSVAKQPRVYANGTRHCPNEDCEEVIYIGYEYCLKCGTKIDWSE